MHWKSRLGPVVSRVPRYLGLGWDLARSPQIPAKHKRLLAGGVLYAVSPLDLVPGVIPVLGQLDDLGLLLWSIRRTLRHCPPDLRQRLLAERDLSLQQLDEDLNALRLVARELAGTLARGAWKGGAWLGSRAARWIAAGTAKVRRRSRDDDSGRR